MSLPPEVIDFQLEHITDNRQHAGLVTAMVLASLATFAVILRLWARRIMRASLKLDDYLIIAALLVSWGVSCCIFPGLKYGLGKHVILSGPIGVVHFLKLQLAFELLYDCAIPLVKFSILVFYSRIFPGQTFRYCLFAVGAFIIAWFITNVFATFMQCWPTNYFWDRSIPGGHCVNITALLISLAATNMVTDIAILILPMHAVYHLQVPRPQKLAVMGIFLCGGFTCIASIVRLYFLDRVDSDDPTWTTFDPATWSTIEVNLGVISACLPILRPLVRGAAKMRVTLSIYSKDTSPKASKLSNSYASGDGSRPGVASRNASVGNGVVSGAKGGDTYADYSLEHQEYKATLDRDLDPRGLGSDLPRVVTKETGITNEVNGQNGADHVQDFEEKHSRGFGRAKTGGKDEEAGLPKNGINVKKAMEWSEETR